MRNTSLFSMLVAAALSLGAGAAPAHAQPSAIEQFTRATREYALVHRRIEQALGPLVVTSSPSDLIANISAMGAAINRDRGAVRQGDLFTPQLADELRARIAAALAANGLTPAAVTTDEIPEGFTRAALAVRVGGPFPWALGFNMIPCVLDVLPELPPELQYRFVFRDLVLVDVHANVVVDVLPYALAAAEF